MKICNVNSISMCSLEYFFIQSVYLYSICYYLNVVVCKTSSPFHQGLNFL